MSRVQLFGGLLQYIENAELPFAPLVPAPFLIPPSPSLLLVVDYSVETHTTSLTRSVDLRKAEFDETARG